MRITKCRNHLVAIFSGWLLIQDQPTRAATAGASDGPIQATHDLTNEGLVAPIMIDRSSPAFSWKMRYDERGAAQTAYQILVASFPELLEQDKADLWDSGKVKSDDSISVSYAGAKLATLSFGTKTIWEGYTDPTKALVNSTVRSEIQVGANWLQESLCGVRTDINGPGMKHFSLESKIPTTIKSAGTEFESPYGKSKSAWLRKVGNVTWNVRVPPNSTVTARFPEQATLAKILESGKPLADTAGVSPVKEAEVKLGAGSYQFQSPAEP